MIHAIDAETIENLAIEETNLIQFEIQKRKKIHEQETAVKLSERTEATLARQLQQNGLEPTMLRSRLTIVAMAALGLGVDIRVVTNASTRVIGVIITSLLLLGAISLGLIRALGIG